MLFAAEDIDIRLQARIVEKELRLRDDRHRHREIVVVQHSCGLVALSVAKLVGVIARNDKHAVGLPFERLFWSVAAPHRCQATAGEHVDELVQAELDWWKRLSR